MAKVRARVRHVLDAVTQGHGIKRPLNAGRFTIGESFIGIQSLLNTSTNRIGVRIKANGTPPHVSRPPQKLAIARADVENPTLIYTLREIKMPTVIIEL
jgi:hypothetical protein